MRGLLVVMLLECAACEFVFRLDQVVLVDAPTPGEPIARWDFDETSGAVIGDSVEPKLDLVIDQPANVTWDSGALRVNAPVRIRSPGAASKLIDDVVASGRVTVEIWITPADIDLPGSGPGRVFAISGGVSGNASLVVGQTSDRRWVTRLRTSATDTGGEPEVQTGQLISSPPLLTHVVVVHDGTARAIYVDGAMQAVDGFAGDLEWNSTHPIALANESSLLHERPWLGAFHRIEMFASALSQAEIQQRYAAGP